MKQMTWMKKQGKEKRGKKCKCERGLGEGTCRGVVPSSRRRKSDQQQQQARRGKKNGRTDATRCGCDFAQWLDGALNMNPNEWKNGPGHLLRTMPMTLAYYISKAATHCTHFLFLGEIYFTKPTTEFVVPLCQYISTFHRSVSLAECPALRNKPVGLTTPIFPCWHNCDPLSLNIATDKVDDCSTQSNYFRHKIREANVL